MGKDDSTWLNITYGVFGIIVMFVFSKFIDTVSVQFGWADEYEAYLSMIRTFGGLIVGALAVWILCGKKDRHEYFLASIGEVRKVTFPTWEDTRKMTVIVTIVCLIFSGILGVFDALFSAGLSGILGFFGSSL